MALSTLTNGSLLKYERAQNRILHLTRRLVDGEDVHDEILEEYSRLCISLKPSNTEKAFALLIKHRRDSLRRIP